MGAEKLVTVDTDNGINPTYEHIRDIYVCTIPDLCTKRTTTRTFIVTQPHGQEMPCNTQYENLVGRPPYNNNFDNPLEMSGHTQLHGQTDS
jgi:hypothetical protein